MLQTFNFLLFFKTVVNDDLIWAITLCELPVETDAFSFGNRESS